jgi:hypothetical protein
MAMLLLTLRQNDKWYFIGDMLYLPTNIWQTSKEKYGRDEADKNNLARFIHL